MKVSDIAVLLFIFALLLYLVDPISGFIDGLLEARREAKDDKE